jgi:hypothetical protein
MRWAAGQRASCRHPPRAGAQLRGLATGPRGARALRRPSRIGRAPPRTPSHRARPAIEHAQHTVECRSASQAEPPAPRPTLAPVQNQPNAASPPSVDAPPSTHGAPVERHRGAPKRSRRRCNPPHRSHEINRQTPPVCGEMRAARAAGRATVAAKVAQVVDAKRLSGSPGPLLRTGGGGIICALALGLELLRRLH